MINTQEPSEKPGQAPPDRLRAARRPLREVCDGGLISRPFGRFDEAQHGGFASLKVVSAQTSCR